MDKKLAKEYQKFVKNYERDYTKRVNNELTVFMPDDSLAGFVCYKAMNSSGSYILRFASGSATDKLLPSFFYSFMEEAGLDINMSEVPPNLYIKANSDAILEVVASKKARDILMQENFRLTNFYSSEKYLPPNPNRTPEKDNYKKIKGLLKIIGDPCQVNVIPHNFQELDISKRANFLKGLFTQRAEVIGYDYTIMMTDNHVSDVLKMYDWLEKNKSNYKRVPFFSTRDICWVRMDDLHLKMNPQLADHEKRPEFTADYDPEDNLLEVSELHETEVGEQCGELAHKEEGFAVPLFSGRTRTLPFKMDLVKRIRELGIKVKLNKSISLD